MSESANAVREKLWVERDAVEKIEALKDQVRYLTIRTRTMSKVILKLTQHSHQGNIIVVPVTFDEEDQFSRGGVPIGLRDDF